MNPQKTSTKDKKSHFICACQAWQHNSCAVTGFYKEYKGKKYCIMHYPGKEKADDFSIELYKRLDSKNFNFSGVWFPEATYFYQFHFTGEADFSQAKFTTFADFAETIFDRKVSFYGAEFDDDGIFHNAIFRDEADFKFAEFQTEADFNHVQFHKTANFSHAKFANYASFTGDVDKPFFSKDACFSLQHAQIANPEKILFQNIELRPSWFIGVTVCSFVFADVKWKNKINKEIIHVPQIINLSHIKASPYDLLSIAYRQLAINAEENHRYDEAADFRYSSMDVQRRSKWDGMAFWQLGWWYWLLSGYGERSGRAAVSLLLILILFAGAYTQVKFISPIDQLGISLNLSQAILYSLEVGALHSPEPKPLTQIARYITLTETILVPLQTALLALAIRRKFIR